MDYSFRVSPVRVLPNIQKKTTYWTLVCPENDSMRHETKLEVCLLPYGIIF